MKSRKRIFLLMGIPLVLSGCSSTSSTLSSESSSEDVVLKGNGSVVTTGQNVDYDADGNVIEPEEGDDFYGQDADYDSPAFSFTSWEDTVIDNNTGLMWQAVPSDDKFSWSEAVDYCDNLELDGFTEWRLPTAEELFSISDFEEGWPYLDTDYFSFPSSTISGPGGDGSPQGRVNADDDSSESISKDQGQFWTSNYYKVTEEGAAKDVAFGVNHATGHIKAYPASVTGTMGKHVRAVRGDEYGVSNFTDNNDGTITDETSGLMWMSADLDEAMDWEDALDSAENSTFAGYTDWRLPDVKELQSIVNYDGSYPAIDQSLFTCSDFEENENYYYWTGTSAYFSKLNPGYGYAWYVAFGFAVGNDGLDSHGAGAVRFSPKYENSQFEGEGGDNMLNSVRLVRNI
ncbi:MAG: DUF1566 domain-containing protein [Bacilli bacterium]